MFLVSLVIPGGSHAATAEDEELFGEAQFLQEIPLIYAASRMPQQPEDAAGAVTVLDRASILRTGARDLVDLFRWVPGFQVATASGGHSVVAYHGLSSDVSQRMQVFVDGRSLYQSYLFGGVDWSNINIPLEEIDRIEIQRGSNSVTYGANAFLGIVNIITRSAAQSVGWRVQANMGSNGISDQYVRGGHQSDRLQWRVLAGKRSDDGLQYRADGYQTEYLDIRAEWQPSFNQELTLFSGWSRSQFGVGFSDKQADPLRTEQAKSASLYLRYRHTLSADHEWGLGAAWTKESGDDSFDVPLFPTGQLHINGQRQANRYALEYQHFKDLSSVWRASWGGEYRADELTSQQLFNTGEAQTSGALRAYINQEWRPSPFWTLNLGVQIERDRRFPTQTAPRFSINWKPAAEHALKLGYSAAFRTPSLFEQRADWRIADQGRTLDIRYLSTGQLASERVRAWDVVYLGQWPQTGITLDARLFREALTRLITGQLYLLPPEQAYTYNAVAYDLRNNAAVTNNGFEYQLTYRPSGSTHFSINQYFGRPKSTSDAVVQTVTKRSLGLMVSQDLPHGWTVGGGYTRADPVRWLGQPEAAETQKLLTLRLAKAFRWEGSSGTVAATWRRPLGGADEFRERQQLAKQFWLSLSWAY